MDGGTLEGRCKGGGMRWWGGAPEEKKEGVCEFCVGVFGYGVL